MEQVTLTGNGSERGRQHGATLAVQIRSTTQALKSHLRSAGHDPEALARRLMECGLPTVTERYVPDVWDEVAATADAAGLPVADIALLSFLDEVWALTRPGCSVMARRLPDRTQVGQTMDLPEWTIGRVSVLRVEPRPGSVQLVMSYPGMVGLCGASGQVAVAVNALDQFGMSTDGVGVAFIVRHLLTLSSVDEIEAFLREVPHAVGQAFTVGDGTRVATFEAGPGVLRVVSPPDAETCTHTNHPLDLSVRPDHSTSIRLASLDASVVAGRSLSDALSGDVVLDGTRYGDPNSTFAAFVADSSEDTVSFIDGVDLRAGRDAWTSISLL